MSSIPSPLSILCDVTATVAQAAAAIPAFNQGIIVGNSGVIPSVGVNSRTRTYSSGNYPANMIADGFSPTDPEYIGAGLWLGQNEIPPFFLVGCQDPTALGTATIDAAGTGWKVGDQALVTQAGGSLGLIEIMAEAGGIPSAIEVVSGFQGTGYSVAAALPTVAQGLSDGVGLTINITAIGETPLQAMTACRLASSAWYVGMSTTAVDADHILLAQFAQSAQPSMQYLYGTQTLSALTGATGNIFSLVKAASYKRAHGAYSTTQGGAAPNNTLIAAAVAGIAMGLNNGGPNSAFTLEGQTLVGITPEPLQPSQWFVPAGEPGVSTGNNGNVYINFGNAYQNYEQGVNGDGSFFDQTLGIDMLIADIQISVLNAKKALPGGIPNDNAGQTIVLNAVNGACARSATRGFLAGGVWQGITILNLTAGQALPLGYQAQSPSFTTQTSGARAIRKGMPVYVAIILAGSQQSFTIGINVQI
jgi:Protein of unknown function (DUF3383)